MFTAISKIAETFVTVVLDLETKLLPRLGWLDIEEQPIFITKSVVSFLTGRLYEDGEIGYLYQSGPRLFLLTKHPEVSFFDLQAFDMTGNKIQIAQTKKYAAGYLIELAETKFVSELRLLQVTFPNPAFLHYSSLLSPITEHLNNTLYWNDFTKYAKTLIAIKKLFTINELYTKEVLADLLNLVLGLPYIESVGYISSIEETERDVVVSIIDNAQEIKVYQFEKPVNCKVVLNIWQETKGYERVFDIIEIL